MSDQTKTQIKATKAAQTAPAAPTASKKDFWSQSHSAAYAKIFSAICASTFPGLRAFYLSGANYHIQKGTSFPRPYSAAHPTVLLSPEEAVQYYSKGAPKAGDKVSQVLFDRIILAVGGPEAAKKGLALK